MIIGDFMRILIFTEVLSPYVCGIVSYVEVLKRGLEKLGHKVVIVTSSLDVEEAVYMGDIIRCPAKVSHNKYGYECKKNNDPQLIDFICDFKPDVVHIHTDTKIGYMGLTVADKLHVPVVFTIHDYFLDRFASDNSLIWKCKTHFEKKHFVDMLDTANIVTSSSSRAEIFVRRAGRKKEVQLIPTAVDTALFDYRKVTENSIAQTRRKWGLSPNAAVAVFAGSLTIEKNLEFALTAFEKYIKKSDHVQFLIVGDGPETKYLKESCQKRKLDDMVVFAGTVPNDKMPAIYAACDIYASSYDDGLMSMSFVEAMACGLPVLIKEDQEQIAYRMVQNGVNGFVYKNEKEFAEYLKTLAVLDTAKKRRIKKIVRGTIPKDADIAMAKEYIAVYKKPSKK